MNLNSRLEACAIAIVVRKVVKTTIKQVDTIGIDLEITAYAVA